MRRWQSAQVGTLEVKRGIQLNRTGWFIFRPVHFINIRVSHEWGLYLTIFLLAGVPGGVFPLLRDELRRYLSFLPESSSSSSSTFSLSDFFANFWLAATSSEDLEALDRTFDLSNSLMSSEDWHLREKRDAASEPNHFTHQSQHLLRQWVAIPALVVFSLQAAPRWQTGLFFTLLLMKFCLKVH